MRLDGGEAPDTDAAVEAAQFLDAFHGEAGERQPLGQHLRRPAPGDELPEPGERDAHSRLRRELRQKAQVVLVEEPEVLDAVAEDRDAVDAEAEGEALN